MWPFRKTEPEPEPLFVPVPLEHREEFCRLYDEMRNESGSKRLHLYRLWFFAADAMPEDIPSGPCEIHFEDHTIPGLKFTKEQQDAEAED